MVHPEEIKEKVQKRWVDYLKAKINGENDFFPFVVACDKNYNQLSWEEFTRSITLLQHHEKRTKGYGYTMDSVCKETKRFGVQNVPVSITIDTEDDFLLLIGKREEAARFLDIVERTVSEFPELKVCLPALSALVVGNYDDWEGILKVCRYFRHHPCSGQFVRELNIGVHTKFIEQHKKVLRPLLDIIVGDKVNVDASTFYGRFNLKEGDPLVTFRMLDNVLCHRYLAGFTLNTVYLCEFCKLDIPIEKVLVVENKLHVIQLIELLPHVKNTLVVWGSGYKANILKDVSWLSEVELYYWGDMDVQGYEILSLLRRHFPHMKSLMMDIEAVNVHPHRGDGVESRLRKELFLTEQEQEVYEMVKAGNWRYEQEYLPQSFVHEILLKVLF